MLNNNRCNQGHDRFHFHTIKCHPRLQNNNNLSPSGSNDVRGPGDFSTEPRRKLSFDSRVPPVPPPRLDSILYASMKGMMMKGRNEPVTSLQSSTRGRDDKDHCDSLPSPPELPVKLRPTNEALSAFLCLEGYKTGMSTKMIHDKKSPADLQDVNSPVNKTNVCPAGGEGKNDEMLSPPSSSLTSPSSSFPKSNNNVVDTTTCNTTTYPCQSSYSWGVKHYSFSCPHHLSFQCLSSPTKETSQGVLLPLKTTCDSLSSTLDPTRDEEEESQLTSSSSEKDPGKPPPLPPKKKNVIAYMTVVGSYRGPSDAALSMYRHSVHAQHGSRGRTMMSGIPRHVEMSFLPQQSLDSSFLVESVTPLTRVPNQANIVDVSSISLPLRSKHVGGRESVSSSISSSSNENSVPTHPVAPCSSSVSPPPLPPKTFRRKISPPQLPLTVSSTVALKKKENEILQPPDLVSSTNDLKKKKESGEGREQNKSNASQEEEDQFKGSALLEMDVNRYLIFKSVDEDGPDIKGGSIDALVVKATEVSKNG